MPTLMAATGRTIVLSAVLLSLVGGGAGPAFSQDDMDDIMSGFEDESGENDYFGEEEEASEPRWWDVTGSVSLFTAYNYLEHEGPTGTQFQGLSALRLKGNLQLDLDLPKPGSLPDDWKARFAAFGFYDFSYLINGLEEYTPQVLDSYEWDVELTEAWIAGGLHRSVDTKIGRQIVNWGRSDSLRVTDILNPLDNREPGLTDIEDIRRPTLMGRLNYFVGDWSLTALLIPEVRFDKNPPYGSEWFPSIDPDDVLDALGIDAPAGGGSLIDIGSPGGIPDNRPDHFSKYMEYGLAATGIFSGWDVSFYAARYWANSGHVELSPGETVTTIPIDPGDPIFPLPPNFDTANVRFFDLSMEYDRLWMVGTGGNYTWGSWLFKTELAYIDGLEFTFVEETIVQPISPTAVNVHFVIGDTEKGRFDFMGGVEYYGIDNLTVALEVVNRHIIDFDDRLEGFPNYGRKNSVETAIRGTMDFLNDSLQVTILGLIFDFDAGGGSVVRLEGNYEIIDALELSGGIILYQTGDLPLFTEIGQNDRIFARIKYSF